MFNKNDIKSAHNLNIPPKIHTRHNNLNKSSIISSTGHHILNNNIYESPNQANIGSHRLIKIKTPSSPSNVKVSVNNKSRIYSNDYYTKQYSDPIEKRLENELKHQNNISSKINDFSSIILVTFFQ